MDFAGNLNIFDSRAAAACDYRKEAGSAQAVQGV